MAEVQIISDAFARANTSPGAGGTTTGAGNNWTDVAGSTWYISTNQLLGYNYSARYRQYLLRPSSEDQRDARIVVSHKWSGNFVYALLRANPATYDAYAAYVNSSYQVKIVKINGAAQTETALVTVSGPSLTAGSTYTLDFSAVNTDATHCNLTATWKDSGGTTLATASVSGDTSSGVQSAGSYGLSNYFTVAVTGVTTYNEAAVAATALTLSGPASGLNNNASTAFTVALSPGGSTSPTVAVVPSDGGSGGTFSPTSVTLSTATQSATFVYAPTTTGNRTISLSNSGGLTNPSGVTYQSQAAAQVAGSVAVSARSNTTLNLSIVLGTGGTGTLTHRLYRDTSPGFTPGTGNLLGVVTGSSYSDTGLTANTVYWYKLTTTDSLANVATSNQTAAGTTRDPATLVIGVIGDSLNAYKPTETTSNSGTIDVPTLVGRYLSQAKGQHAVTVVNRAVAGQMTSDWLPATSQYIAAKAAMLTAGVQWAYITLGANDARVAYSLSKATYKANLLSIASDLVSAGIKVVINAPPYAVPGSLSNQWTEASTALLAQYQAVPGEIANGATIFAGDTAAFGAVAQNPSWQIDGVHFTASGAAAQAKLYADALSLVPGLTWSYASTTASDIAEATRATLERADGVLDDIAAAALSAATNAMTAAASASTAAAQSTQAASDAAAVAAKLPSDGQRLPGVDDVVQGGAPAEEVATAVWANERRDLTDGAIVQQPRTQSRQREIIKGDTYGQDARQLIVQASDGGQWPASLDGRDWYFRLAKIAANRQSGTGTLQTQCAVLAASGATQRLRVNLDGCRLPPWPMGCMTTQWSAWMRMTANGQ
ncbi:MAG: SGNH/GDSL hydrolase family protein [Tepidisphaeraceae bacterium]